MEENKDEKVMDFMRQIVREKYGNQVESDFVEKEANKIYSEFENNLVSYFKPLISDQKKVELDRLVDKSANQSTILAFLMDSIESFEQKIVQVLVNFRGDYIKSRVNE